MSDNFHYRAIQSLITDLVAAIEEFPDIATLLQKAWNKKLIEPIHTKSSPKDTAVGLVSAVATSVNKRPEVFYQFVALLKDTNNPGLLSIAARLEQELEVVVDMSGASGADNSSSLSDGQPKAKPSPRSPRRSSDSERTDALKKLEPFDEPTYESGFQDLGSGSAVPIAGEQVNLKSNSTDAVPHVEYQATPYVKDFTSLSGSDKSNVLVPKSSGSNQSIQPADTNPNTAAESEISGPIDEYQELVISTTQQSAGVVDVTEKHVAAILQDNKRKVSRIESLENELSAYASRELSLERKINELTQKNSSLQQKLAEEKEKTEKNLSVIDCLKNQIQQKEEEVEVVRKQLADVEKISEENKKELLEQIESLRDERDELEKKKSEYKEKYEERREKYNNLKEEYNTKVAEENKMKIELSDLRREVLQLKYDHLQATSVSKADHESIVQQQKEQLEKTHNASLTSLKEQSERRIEELEKKLEGCIPFPPPGRSSSPTESSTSDNPAVNSQVSISSQTESGQATRSNSKEDTSDKPDPANSKDGTSPDHQETNLSTEAAGTPDKTSRPLNGTAQQDEQVVPVEFQLGSSADMVDLDDTL